MNVIVHHFCRFSTKTLLFLCPSTEFSFFDGSEKNFFSRFLAVIRRFRTFFKKIQKNFQKTLDKSSDICYNIKAVTEQNCDASVLE